MRITKSGHRNRQDLDTQDYSVQVLRPRRLIAGNLRACLAMLSSNLDRFGSELPAEEKRALELIVFNMKCLNERMKG